MAERRIFPMAGYRYRGKFALIFLNSSKRQPKDSRNIGKK